MSADSAPRPLDLNGIGIILVTMILWAVGPLFVKYFTFHYDVWTQNAARYLAASVLLLAFAGARRWRVFALSRRQWTGLGVVSLSNVFMQTFFALMLYHIYPSVATLVGQINIVVVVVLSFLLFRDERSVIRSPRFLAGSALTLLGVAAVVLGRSAEILERLDVGQREFWIGVALAVVWSVFSALYAVAIKPVVREVEPLVAFTNVSWMTTVGLGALALVFGRVSDLWRQPAISLLGLIATGILCIAVAHSLYYAAIRKVRLVIVVTFLQLQPVLTCILSALWYGDKLSAAQWAGGLAALGGAWLASLALMRGPARERWLHKLLAAARKPA
jgi:drug/metabolite transporter (DMT)-like permease